jgi:hypothetical protein
VFATPMQHGAANYLISFIAKKTSKTRCDEDSRTCLLFPQDRTFAPDPNRSGLCHQWNPELVKLAD